MDFLWLNSEYFQNQLIIVAEMRCVFFQVRSEFLNII
jgi:hypothetical protein